MDNDLPQVGDPYVLTLTSSTSGANTKWAFRATNGAAPILWSAFQGSPTVATNSQTAAGQIGDLHIWKAGNNPDNGKYSNEVVVLVTGAGLNITVGALVTSVATYGQPIRVFAHTAVDLDPPHLWVAWNGGAETDAGVMTAGTTPNTWTLNYDWSAITTGGSLVLTAKSEGQNSNARSVILGLP